MKNNEEHLDKILNNLIEHKTTLPIAKSQILKIFGESENSFTANQLKRISEMLKNVSKESFEAANKHYDWEIWWNERNKIFPSKIEIYSNCDVVIDGGCNVNNCVPDCLFKQLYR